MVFAQKTNKQQLSEKINIGKQNNNVLVTGGAGYIGSHVCKHLKNCGYRPITFDNLSEGYMENVQWGPLELGDLTDLSSLKAVFEKYQPKAVMHFAAFALVGESMAKPAKYYGNNLLGTLNLLKTMLEFNVKALVFSSTCATYGIPQTETINENHPQNPINPYGRSKLMIENILKDYEAAYHLKSVSLRYFNAAGADFEGLTGENHRQETHLIPLAIKTALGQIDHLSVFGTDFPTKDGSAIRDYIHVQDLAEAHLKAVEYLLSDDIKTKNSLFLNLGTGYGFSVLEILKKIQEITGRKINAINSQRRPGDPPKLVAANSGLARKSLNFQPLYSDIESIISSAWHWHSALLKKPIKTNQTAFTTKKTILKYEKSKHPMTDVKK